MHRIRKTYGSKLFNSNVALTTVKDLLGHANEATTMKYYIFDTSDDVKRTNQILNALKANEPEKATT